MKIAYKLIEHERTEDAPFVGALICAQNCKFKCKGCYNQHLKRLPSIYKTAEDIIAEVKSNPFNEGIILGGLEWSLQPIAMIELIEEASKQGLKVIIYTGCDLDEFHYRIGKACADSTNFKMDLPKVMGDSQEMYRWVGAYMLDYYIPADYYIKTGRYDDSKKVEGREHFGVSLATSNQSIFLIKKVEDDGNEN